MGNALVMLLENELPYVEFIKLNQKVIKVDFISVITLIINIIVLHIMIYIYIYIIFFQLLLRLNLLSFVWK